MELLHTSLAVGAPEPFTVLHMSDTHLTKADERNDERKIKLAERRKNSFPEEDEMLPAAAKLAKENNCPIIHTGDLIDFVSEANLDEAEKFISENDCFAAAGNHEFSLYVGEAREDAAYRAQSLPRVQRAFGNDIRFSSRIIGGVNFVAVDNSYYLFEPFQLEGLKTECEKGLPVVLCVHTPLYEEKLYDFLMRGRASDEPAYLMSVPEEKMKNYTPDRYFQQKEDEVTREAYEYILSEKRIRCILTGHVHCAFEFPIADKMQLGVGCTDLRLVRFK